MNLGAACCRLVRGVLAGGLAAFILAGQAGCVGGLTELQCLLVQGECLKQLSEPLLMLSIPADQKAGAGFFRVERPGLYAVELSTWLKDATVPHYKLPRFTGRLAGRGRISSAKQTLADHPFDFNWTSTSIRRGLFRFKTPGLIPLGLVSLPRKEDLTFQVEITAIDSPMPELYKTLVFSIRRRGTIMD